MLNEVNEITRFIYRVKFKCGFMGWVLLWIAAVLSSSCSIVPGTYLGITPKISETEREYVYEADDTQDIAERADIYTITRSTIDAMKTQRQESSEKKEVSLHRENSIASEYSYKVQPQDSLLVTVWNNPDLNNPAGTLNQLSGRVVNEDGTFFFPYAGKIKAAGRTVLQIRDELADKLAKYLVDPQVDVSVLQYRSQRALVTGEVVKPGLIPITDVPLTVADSISQSGGLSPNADLTAATITREGKVIPVDLYALYYRGDSSQNLILKNGDILNIPENRFKKVFVMGEVLKPQSLVMPRGRLTLAEALADAGGFNPLTANAGQMYVIRAGENNRPQIWYLNAASPDALVLADAFDLKPRDIVYVDPAGVARFSRVINNIIPTANFLYRTTQ